jgi:hypothetical protein
VKRHTKVDVAALLERIKAEGPDAVISRAEATALIASRTMDARDALRSARNRVGVQLDRAIAFGEAGHDISTGGITLLPRGGFTADELGRWANRRYNGKFSDMPGKPRAFNDECHENLSFGAEPSTVLLPGDVARAQAMILELLAEIEEAKSKEQRAIEARNRALGERFNQTGK